jgi:hypothetical protein
LDVEPQLFEQIGRDQPMGMARPQVDPVEDDDRLALVSGFRDQPFRCAHRRAAGEERGAWLPVLGRRLAARHVVRILHVHRPVARLELLTHELEGAGADGVGDLPKRTGFRGPLGHDERHQAGSLREPVEQQWERFLEPDPEGVVVPAGHLVERGGERLAQRVAYRPAPQRRHAISATHRDLKFGYGWK